jgi:CrcB protein
VAFALVAAFGALGSLLRYGVAVALAGVATWPLATLLVNLVGSCALGVVTELLVEHRICGVDARLAWGTGLLGGFTTYSAFDIETLAMIERGEVVRGVGYLAATVLGCLAAGALGLALGRALKG